MARRFLVDKKRYDKLELKVRIVYDILRRRVTKLSNIVNQINKGQYTMITADEWAIITETA